MRSLLGSRWALAVAIVALTLIAWGGRIGLLTGAESRWSWLRIVGSLLFGLLAALSLVVPQMATSRRPLLLWWALWSVVIWARSVIVNWLGSGSLPFKLVHTVLAAGFFIVAWWAFTTATRGNAVAGPDEGHGEEEREGEAARLTES